MTRRDSDLGGIRGRHVGVHAETRLVLEVARHVFRVALGNGERRLRVLQKQPLTRRAPHVPRSFRFVFTTHRRVQIGNGAPPVEQLEPCLDRFGGHEKCVRGRSSSTPST